VTGLPLPRFASLRTDEVNMRTGPGTRYPIDWVLRHKGLPVEIIAEYEIWRRIREPDGAEGWVHKTALTGKRFGLVKATGFDLHDGENQASAIIAHLEKGAVGQISSCTATACKMVFDDAKGWVAKTALWGVYPTETIR
jgi:SH3-like domain-containing protein